MAMPVWFHTYSAETVEAWRALRQRSKKNPVLSAWFFILMVVFIGMILAVAGYSARTGTEFITLDAGAIVLLTFFIFLAKSLATSVRKVVRHQPLVFFMSQPHRHGEFLIGLLCGEIMFNLGLLAMVVGIAYAEILVLGFVFTPNPVNFAQLILAVIMGSTLGFTASIFNAVYPLKRRIPLLVLVSLPTAILYIIMDTIPGDPRSVLYLTLPLTIAIFGLLPAFHIFLETWNRATAAASGLRKSVYDRTTGRFAPRVMRWVGWESSLFLEKEMVERYRSKEVFGSSIAVAAVAFATIYSLGKLPDMEFIPYFVARILPPMIIGMGLFVGAILEPGISALSSFGKEGKAIWVVKTSPVTEREITKAKALASTYTVPLLAVFVGAVPAILAGYGVVPVLFASLFAASMSIIAIGVGIWLGARAPNFDPSVKGYPDIITIYTYSMACLFLCFMVAAPSFFLLLQSGFLGILAAIFVLDMAVLFLYGCIGLSARELQRMEAP